MSTPISRFENIFSLQLDRLPKRLDTVGQRLLARILDLLAHRSDVTQRDFLRAMGRPTPSWRSEFFSGQRTTNDLRLVMKMARYFGVTTSYLLAEDDRAPDAETMTLLSAWDAITDERDRKAVLSLALQLKPRNGGPGTGQSNGPASEPLPGGGTTKGPRKHR